MSIGFIAGVPHHPSFQRAVHTIRNQPINRPQVNEDTGPRFWRTCVNLQDPDVFQMETADMYPDNWDGTINPRTPSFVGYGRHHWHGSWVPKPKPKRLPRLDFLLK
jgi:hypothetical protein